ncbi:MAG: nitroreductase family protein [Bacillota bacterium]
MDFEEVLFNRRSKRSFIDKDVDDNKIKKLLEAAMAAPSAHNKQPWQFVVIRDNEIMDKIMEFHKYSKMLEEAPVAIAVCGDKNAYKDFWVQDCSAATQNLLLMAENLGLGAVWLGVYPVEEYYPKLADLLELPDDLIPLNVIAIGYSDKESKRRDRYDESKVHYK